MLALARQTLAGTRGQLQYAHIEAFEVPAFEGFDVVVSRLALHYVEDLPSVLRRVHRALVAGGRLVLSVEHPVITSCDRGWGGRGPRADWLVDDYFVTGRRETSWLGGRVVKFHRTIEDYLVALESAGFAWEALREPGPQRPAFASEAEFRRRQRIPLFLLLAARRLDEPASAVATEEGA
jgi:SAM-dependent methyltransferase